MTRKFQLLAQSTLCLIVLLAAVTSHAQITPLGDSYTDSADPTTNYGIKTLLDVDGATQISYIQFNLASIPSGATASQATLKLYVNAVTTAGSFNVDYVTSAWTESTLTYDKAPTLGTTIVSDVALTTADKSQYILINLTPAVQAWLSGSETNDGIALVANSTFNATFDSKESTTTSHPAELDIVFAPGSGTITGVTTASGSGLMGGGTSGTLNLSLLNTCSSGQVLEWNGSAWACATGKGTGTITGVTAGTDLTGGGSSGKVTLNLNTTSLNSSYPQLAVANTFTGNNVFDPSTTADAIDAYASGTGKTALVGIEYATSGGSYGVWSETFDSSGAGVKGINRSSSAPGIGVLGQNIAESATGAGVIGIGGGGVWGDGGTTSNNWGVIGTVDDGHAAIFENNSPSGYATVFIQSLSSNSGPLYAYGPKGGCDIDSNGDLSCSGTKNAVVPIDGGKRMVALSAIESPKNWFEDAGSAQLVNGSAVVALDHGDMQTVNTEMEYNVFLTPYGDCKGLYVTNRTANSFEVRELGGGSASLSFGYRIMALRKNYEKVRFADHTHDLDATKKMMQRAAMKGAQP